MAKFEESDPRWLVKDLGEQGRNVNNWHWEEKNALPWSKSYLEELLSSVILVDEDSIKASISFEEKPINIKGDAIINQRKGKLIPAYEIELAIPWIATVSKEGSHIKGEIKAPYISEENHDEDPELLVSTEQSDTIAEKVRQLVIKKGRPIIQEKVAIFVRELRAGGPLKKNSTDSTESQPSSSIQAPQQDPSPALDTAGTDAAKDTKPESSSSRSITITENFFASSRDLYECFTETARVRAYTGSEAILDPRPGGTFSMFGGSIEGTYRELQPHSLLDMDWRFSSWPDSSTSRVIITLEEKEKGSVALTLKQTNIPDQDRYGNHDVLSMTQAGWKQQVLMRIRQVFGYGA